MPHTFNEDVEALGLSESAVCLFVCALAWAKRAGSGGFVHHRTVDRLKGGSEATAAELCGCGWWQRATDGFTIVDFQLLTVDASVRRYENMRRAGGNHQFSRRRALVFALQGRKCADCGSTEDLTVDHIVPVSKGGTNALENLRVLCRSCNSKKGDMEVQRG